MGFKCRNEGGNQNYSLCFFYFTLDGGLNMWQLICIFCCYIFSLVCPEIMPSSLHCLPSLSFIHPFMVYCQWFLLHSTCDPQHGNAQLFIDFEFLQGKFGNPLYFMNLQTHQESAHGFNRLLSSVANCGGGFLT